MTRDAPLQRLHAALDGALVGHDEAAVGLMLALVARQHAWLEGPPGCGKTRLAETLARASGARVGAVRFHRDTREADLLGDVLLRRSGAAGGAARGGIGATGGPGTIEVAGGSERLQRRVEPGPLLRAEVALLDDLDRAPGEALGPLARILAERRFGGSRLPL